MVVLRLFGTHQTTDGFDNSKVQMPTPLEYLKYVRTGTTENQTDFDITSTYSSIEDLFGVFF
jgi:hypothetical protein